MGKRNQYKRTLLAAEDGIFDKTVAWVEGAEFKPPSGIEGFTTVGGNINTNTGISFTKRALERIIAHMPPDAVLKVAGCHNLYIDSEHGREGVIKEFERCNAMIYIGNNTWQHTK